jgi:hypothetical protein
VRESDLCPRSRTCDGARSDRGVSFRPPCSRGARQLAAFVPWGVDAERARGQNRLRSFAKQSGVPSRKDGRRSRSSVKNSFPCGKRLKTKGRRSLNSWRTSVILAEPSYTRSQDLGFPEYSTPRLLCMKSACILPDLFVPCLWCPYLIHSISTLRR